MKARPALAVVLLTAWSIVAPAQRLSPTTIPEHYDIHLAPDFATDTFAGQVGISVRLSEPIARDHVARRRNRFSRGDDRRRRNDPGRQRHARRRQRNGDVHRAAADPRRRGRDCDALHRAAQRPAARLLSEPREQPRLRHHAARGHRRAPRVSIVRRAGHEGDVRGICHDRHERHGDLERAPDVGHARARRRQTHADIRHDETDVALPRRARGRRLDVRDRRRRRHSDPGLRDAESQRRSSASRSSRRSSRCGISIATFSIKYPFEKLDIVAVPDFSAGAMENTGAIFFREQFLVVAKDGGTTGTAQADRAVHRPRNRASVVRRSRHDGVVGRHLAERGIRHLDGVPPDAGIEARVARRSSTRCATPSGRWTLDTLRATRPVRTRWRRRTRSIRSSTRLRIRRPRPSSGWSKATSAPRAIATASTPT